MNAGDKESRTPLHYASGFDHADIAQMLVDEGAQLEAKDIKGNTPLHYAAGYGRARLVCVYRLKHLQHATRFELPAVTCMNSSWHLFST